MRARSPLETRLAALRAAGKAGLVPFLTAGHPTLEATVPLLSAVERGGAVAAEVGVPFTDPLADGPAIQRSSQVALENGVTLPILFEALARFRAGSDLPLVLMSYANPVLAFGVEAFCRGARAAGVSAILLTDLPPEERPDVWEALESAGLDAILLVAPTTDAARRRALAERGRGFVYCVSRTGITGDPAAFAQDLGATVVAVRAATSVPVGVGFGVRDEERAREAARLADAVIVGAALCERLEETREFGVERAVEQAESLVRRLATAVGSVRKAVGGAAP